VKLESIKAGDIVVFERDRQTLHARVSSKGFRYICSPFTNTDEPILFVRVLEHPEWKEIVLTSKDVIDVIILREKVQFS